MLAHGDQRHRRQEQQQAADEDRLRDVGERARRSSKSRPPAVRLARQVPHGVDRGREEEHAGDRRNSSPSGVERQPAVAHRRRRCRAASTAADERRVRRAAASRPAARAGPARRAARTRAPPARAGSGRSTEQRRLIRLSPSATDSSVGVDVVELAADVEDHDPHHEHRDEDVEQHAQLDQQRLLAARAPARTRRSRSRTPGSPSTWVSAFRRADDQEQPARAS